MLVSPTHLPEKGKLPRTPFLANFRIAHNSQAIRREAFELRVARPMIEMFAGMVHSSRPRNQVSYGFSAIAREPCKSKSSTHQPNSGNGSRQITTVSRSCGWVFTTNAQTGK